jgi:carbonic anhydrase
MVVHTDMSMLSVPDYAANVLGVRHVIVCGHYGCGGIRAARGHKQFGLIDNWIWHIKDVYRIHEDELRTYPEGAARENRFTEINVTEQVFDLIETSIIQNAWAKNQLPYVQGWVYDIHRGLIKDLNVTMNDNSKLPEMYRFNPPALPN